jgi:hypothetical protein
MIKVIDENGRWWFTDEAYLREGNVGYTGFEMTNNLIRKALDYGAFGFSLMLLALILYLFVKLSISLMGV